MTRPFGLSKEDLIAESYVWAWKGITRIPAPVARRLFMVGADIASRRGKQPARLRSNLAKVTGCTDDRELDVIVRKAMRSYARYWMEAFRLPSIIHSSSLDSLVNTIESGIQGVDLFDKSYRQGRGVILALPHSGNWDMAGLWLAQRYGTFYTVAERLKPEKLFDAFVEYREGLGFTVFPLTGGSQKPMDGLRATLESGGVVALLGERDLSHHGVSVDFFGSRTTMPVGAVRLAQQTGAALHGVHCWFTPDGWGHSVGEPLDTDKPIPEVVQDLARVFEKNISEHPEDWHMLQRIWNED
ncbi:phosphatidylinositol mannoside acyltransferase [Corynebacterium kroppenstedtii]|uniref:phosphatidylinositol mannoside acyltransferase n=1 Tax=Corynebacterium kroppenstedtii TaxID=161879 RepID=UPI0026545E97|nr:phosphatidylinositol mannoside acyltransferase [Corynebacterium kroppenstedtii]MDN8623537.1 phosphatidylinositol mannoside acyltransferase [Corynebacterium kroppenstedtii]